MCAKPDLCVCVNCFTAGLRLKSWIITLMVITIIIIIIIITIIIIIMCPQAILLTADGPVRHSCSRDRPPSKKAGEAGVP